MPQLLIDVEGKGGAYDAVFQGRKRIDLPQDVPIRMETREGRLPSGRPSITLIIEVPGVGVVVAETSLRLFQTAAAATYGRYGDQTDGGLKAHLDGGIAHLRFSEVQKCGSCGGETQSDFRFCPQCGARPVR